MAKIKIEKHLFERAKKYAETAGYSSVDELVVHMLEKAMGGSEEPDSEESVKRRLKGLGYID